MLIGVGLRASVLNALVSCTNHRYIITVDRRGHHLAPIKLQLAT